MIICSFCSTPNREGELYCQECGNPLQGSPRIATRKLESMGVNPSQRKPFWGTTRFTPSADVLLRIENANDSIDVENKDKITIGRSDQQSNHYPDIDLTPYGAVDEGVSRAHACFQRSEEAITIIDLDSANGTYLNGNRLLPNQPRVLQDGDELRFGRLVARVYFKAEI